MVTPAELEQELNRQGQAHSALTERVAVLERKEAESLLEGQLREILDRLGAAEGGIGALHGTRAANADRLTNRRLSSAKPTASQLLTWSATALRWEPGTLTATGHGVLTGGDAVAADHTDLARLGGRAGGQTLIGGTAASQELTLQSTANATRGVVRSNDAVVIGSGALSNASTSLDFTETTRVPRLPRITNGQLISITDIPGMIWYNTDSLSFQGRRAAQDNFVMTTQNQLMTNKQIGTGWTVQAQLTFDETAAFIAQVTSSLRHLTFANHAAATAVTSTFAGDLRINGNDILDSGGNTRITMAASGTNVTLTGVGQVTTRLGVGGAPVSGFTLIVPAWQADAATLALFQLQGTSTLTANRTQRAAGAYTAIVDLAGFNLTRVWGHRSAVQAKDSAGGGILTDFQAFIGALTGDVSGIGMTMTNVDTFLADSPTLGGTETIGTLAGMRIKDQGASIPGAGTKLSALLIAAQTDQTAFYTTQRTLDILGTVIPSSHQPALMVGATAAPTAKLHVQEATLANEVFRIESVATNDDPSERVFQNRAATTDATVTTLHTVTIPASTTVQVIAYVTARRTGGAAGTAEDGAAYMIQATVKNVAGTATLIGAVNQLCVQEDQVGWDATIDVTAATARVRVTGAASNNITWHGTIRVLQVGS